MGCENKFKVGDRVRAIHTSGGGGVQAGDVFVVTKSEDGYLNFFNHRVGRDDGWGANYFELALTIEPGKHYRTRSGKPTGRVTVGDTGFEAVVDGRVGIFDKAGGAVYSDDDIVEAWVPKVGERVRRFKGHNPGSLVGHEAVVRAVEDILPYDSEGPWLLFDDDTSGYATSFEPLPVAPQPAAQEPATFKVGDKVRICARHPYILAPNEHTGVVVSINDHARGTVRVEIDNYGGSLSFMESELSLRNSETPATNVGAQVDTLAEEYGPAPAATASNDNAAAEPDTTLHIKFTSDFSELDAAILVRKKKLKKLIKLARKAGIDLREAA